MTLSLEERTKPEMNEVKKELGQKFKVIGSKNICEDNSI